MPKTDETTHADGETAASVTSNRSKWGGTLPNR